MPTTACPTSPSPEVSAPVPSRKTSHLRCSTDSVPIPSPLDEKTAQDCNPNPGRLLPTCVRPAAHQPHPVLAGVANEGRPGRCPDDPRQSSLAEVCSSLGSYFLLERKALPCCAQRRQDICARRTNGRSPLAKAGLFHHHNTPSKWVPRGRAQPPGPLNNARQ